MYKYSLVKIFSSFLTKFFSLIIYKGKPDSCIMNQMGKKQKERGYNEPEWIKILKKLYKEIKLKETKRNAKLKN